MTAAAGVDDSALAIAVRTIAHGSHVRSDTFMIKTPALMRHAAREIR
jgi:hypothetical protein